MAMILTGGLMLGLCGCGSSGDSTAASVSTEEVAVTPTDTVKPEMPTVSTEFIGSESLPDYFTESESEDTMPAEDLGSTNLEAVESETLVASIDIDLSEIMTEHIFEDEDLDGYQTQNTVFLSPIFREEDMDTLVATWEALGGDADDIPVREECYNWDSQLQRASERCGFSGAQYIVGSWEILNHTEGFDITPNNSRSFALGIYMEPDDNGLQPGVYENISHISTTAYTFFGDGLMKNKSSMGTLSFGYASMDSNQWGPTLFIIVLPDKVAPNLPNGYDCHSLLFSFGSYLYNDKFYISYYNELN